MFFKGLEKQNPRSGSRPGVEYSRIRRPLEEWAPLGYQRRLVAKPIPKIKAGNGRAADNGQHAAQDASGVVGVVVDAVAHVALQ